MNAKPDNEIKHAERPRVIFPVQCSCGHLFLEKYQFRQPTKEGIAGFCWCGFCRTRLNLYTDGRAVESDGASKGKTDVIGVVNLMPEI